MALNDFRQNFASRPLFTGELGRDLDELERRTGSNSVQNNFNGNNNNNSDTIIIANNTTATTNTSNSEPYWKRPLSSQNQTTKKTDLVVIHVCDENQQITRDFCCERQVLINNMKYFQKFCYFILK